MAYVSKELAAQKRSSLKRAFPAKQGWKFSVRKHHGSIRIAILKAPFDLRADYIGKTDFISETGNTPVNEFHLENSYKGKGLTALQEIKNIAMDGNWDKSDIMTDYFDVGWYLDLSIGTWEKAFEVS